MTNTDLILIYKKFEEIDKQLKELQEEIGKIRYSPPSYSNTALIPTTPFIDKPAQWPNEPYTDYLKRIGEYNEAQVYEDDTK